MGQQCGRHHGPEMLQPGCSYGQGFKVEGFGFAVM